MDRGIVVASALGVKCYPGLERAESRRRFDPRANAITSRGRARLCIVFARHSVRTVRAVGIRRARALVACYTGAVGRLDNIIARNRGPNRMNERVIVSMVMGLVVLLIIGLAVFTDLGRPPEARDAPAASGAPGAPSAPAARGRVRRVDDVLLATPPARLRPRPSAQ